MSRNVRRAVAVLIGLASAALVVFLALNLSALFDAGFARASAGDLLWTVGGGALAITGLGTGRKLWRSAAS